MIDEIIIFTMCLILLIGCIVSLLLSHYYNNLIFASENMGITNNIFLKQLKFKYENLYRYQMYLCNTNSFIKKHLYKLKLLRIPLYFWDRLLNTLKYFCIFVGSFSCYICLTIGYSITSILPYIALTMITYFIMSILSLYISVDIKRDILITNLQEYIENYLNPRLSSQLEKESSHGTKECLQKNKETKSISSSNKEGFANHSETDCEHGQNTSPLSNNRAIYIEIQEKRSARIASTSSSSSLQGHDLSRPCNPKINEEIIENILMEFI